VLNTATQGFRKLPFSEIFRIAGRRRAAIFFIGGVWEKQRTTGNGQQASIR